MAELTPELQSLLKEVRAFLANSNDPWESRQDLITKINNVLPGGEMELFVGSIREMARIGSTYANTMQTFNQLYASQQMGANLADMFTRAFGPNPFLGPGLAPNAFDYFKQMSDFIAAQSKTLTKPGKK